MTPVATLRDAGAVAASGMAAGLTLVELLVTLALAVSLLVLAAPRMRELVITQRLKGVQAELQSNLQFARSEALRRNRAVRIDWDADDAQSCYVLSAPWSEPDTGRCDCRLAAGTACGPAREEIRVARLARSTGVTITPRVTGDVRIEPVRGSVAPAGFAIDVEAPGIGASIRTTVSEAGQPAACAPSAAVSPVPPCR